MPILSDLLAFGWYLQGSFALLDIGGISLNGKAAIPGVYRPVCVFQGPTGNIPRLSGYRFTGPFVIQRLEISDLTFRMTWRWKASSGTLFAGQDAHSHTWSLVKLWEGKSKNVCVRPSTESNIRSTASRIGSEALHPKARHAATLGPTDQSLPVTRLSGPSLTRPGRCSQDTLSNERWALPGSPANRSKSLLACWQQFFWFLLLSVLGFVPSQRPLARFCSVEMENSFLFYSVAEKTRWTSPKEQYRPLGRLGARLSSER